MIKKNEHKKRNSWKQNKKYFKKIEQKKMYRSNITKSKKKIMQQRV